MKKLLLIAMVSVLGIMGCTQIKKCSEPFGVTPKANQMKWQEMNYYMFIHFGPNTFTDMEWGLGDENPELFNPEFLDCNQWAKTAKEAGMKGIIITAKHHDGFCLWPSKYSTHTVRESKWKDGKGDVLKELSEACKKFDLKFGVYLSPWDRNHPQYGTPEYNQVFADMIEEVTTNYGPVFEFWLDGANGEGPNGKKQVYDWDLFHNAIYKNQPDCVIFSDVGPGCRWVGNERGIAGTTNWSTMNIKGFGPGLAAPATDILNQGQEGGEAWVPAECDVSIRPGWFYSPKTDDKVKTLEELMTIYYGSIGRNANLLLNVPVDRRGLIYSSDSVRLMEFRSQVEKDFESNLVAGGAVSVLQGDKIISKQEKLLTDNNFDTYFAGPESDDKLSFEMNLGKAKEINCILLQEYIPLGQRVKQFSVEYWDGEKYVEAAKQTTIGFKRIFQFPKVNTDKVRINILESLSCPLISEIQVFNNTVFPGSN